jgi:MinD-like ATPase involved in chromosome partitioning or flagellar assembly
MTESRDGQVVTFYSHKGGTGRTMALANVAWILAANGLRVLTVDWDLESPGLHRFFKPFLRSTPEPSSGVINMINRYLDDVARNDSRLNDLPLHLARVQRHVTSLDWEFPGGGVLDYLPAGRQNSDYATVLAGLNWDDFYERHGGGMFFDALRDDMKANYDFALIDSRSGFSDVADICTIQLPDILVDCFTLNDQGIEGAALVAQLIVDHQRSIRILPVPMRVDEAEKNKADIGRSLARRHFTGFPQSLSDAELDRYWARVEVPYRSFYAYEEVLSTFGDPPGSPRSLLASYEAQASYLTDGRVSLLPPIDDGLRRSIMGRFERHDVAPDQEIVLHCHDNDQAWAEWIERLLMSVGIRVVDPQAASTSTITRDLVVVSYSSFDDRVLAGTRNPLVVYVDDLRPISRFPMAGSVFAAGKPERTVADRLLTLVGLRGVAPEPDAGGSRFPGRPSEVFQAPARNPQFTGRYAELRELRTMLRSQPGSAASGGAVVALTGMGGIGKSQLALEYAHRFRNAYDVVWWVGADPPAFLPNELADLGDRLGLPKRAGIEDTVQVVLHSLQRGTPHSRWLIIFDNADDIDVVARFLPGGPGHVLVTSRNVGWQTHARHSMMIDVFERRDSVAHLRGRVPTIRLAEADSVAEALGDLPIAVSAAGAWLADTGVPAGDYLRGLSRSDARMPFESSVSAIWDVSLDRLRERSAAAYRLLQLCSVMAPEISLDLVYGEDFAELLVPLDPLMSERLYRGSLVQQISRLALMKVGVANRTVTMHRLTQYVVRSRMSAEELRRTRHEVHLVLAAARPHDEADNPQSWPRYRLLWPHLDVTEAVECGHVSVQQLVIDRVRYLWAQGALAEARATAERVDHEWTAMLGASADETDRQDLRRQLLLLRSLRATVLRDLAFPEQSLELDRAVVVAQVDLLGRDHPHTLITAGGLAADLRALGRYDEALARERETYRTWVDVLGEDSPRSLSALRGLAESTRLVGDFRGAREQDTLVYERSSMVLGSQHPGTLTAAVGLGIDLRDAGEFEPSVALLTTTVSGLEGILGRDARATIEARLSLAFSISAAGRSEQAAPIIEAAHAELRDVLGPDNPGILAGRMAYGLSLLALGEVTEAEGHLDAVYTLYLQRLGDRHPHVLTALHNLAVVSRLSAGPVMGRQQAEQAARQFTEVLGSRHPRTLRAQSNVATFLIEDGEHARGAELLDSLLERLERVLGADHPDTLRAETHRALADERAGRGDSRLTASVERLGRAIGTAHPVVARLRSGHPQHYLLVPYPL